MSAGWALGSGVEAVLCIGAHVDDIEIGCGGTLLRLARENPEIRFDWVVLAPGDEKREREAAASSRSFLDARIELHLGSFRERYLPYDSEVKEYFDRLGVLVQPDLIFCPRLDDAHQDHRTVAELTWNTFRGHHVIEYEIAKYEGDLGQPNLFVPLSEEDMERKVEHLYEVFRSQHDKYWFKADTFRSLAQIRGVECRSDSGYAEAFHARKLVVR